MEQNKDSKRGVEEAVRKLCACFLHGEMAPGARFHSYGKLMRKFSLSRSSVRQLVQELKRDGFLCGKERQGLYVAGRLPCHWRVALLSSLPLNRKNLFQKDFPEIFECRAAARGWSVAVYDDLAESEKNRETLRYELSRSMLRGVVFMTSPRDVLATLPDGAFAEEILKFTFSPRFDFPNLVSFCLRDDRLIASLVGIARKNACSRIVYIGMPNLIPHFQRAMEGNGLPVDPARLFPLPLQAAPQLIRNVTAALLSLPAKIRPDCLCVSNENFISAVLEGVAVAGCGIPEDVTVVAHCNRVPKKWEASGCSFAGFNLETLSDKILERLADSLPPARQESIVPRLWRP